MKWFTATNEGSIEYDAFFELLVAAILSAKKNTSLNPHLLYEGSIGHPRIQWLKEVGVSIVQHELSFRKQIESFCEAEGLGNEKARHRAGAYLRTELPMVLHEHSIDDTLVLYTDCDVLFMSDPDLSAFKPRYFAAYGHWEGGYTRFHFRGYQHFNSGVMLMNIPRMLERYHEFVDFVINDGYNMDRPGGRYWNKNLILTDQVAYNLFYKNEIDNLPADYNWNPYKGGNEKAVIIHFNGVKWNQIDDLISGELDKPDYALRKYMDMYKKSRGYYDYCGDFARDLLEECGGIPYR